MQIAGTYERHKYKSHNIIAFIRTSQHLLFPVFFEGSIKISGS